MVIYEQILKIFQEQFKTLIRLKSVSLHLNNIYGFLE